MTFAVALALGALDLTHPTWGADAIAQAILASGGWWIPLHVLLILGYAVLVYTLWPSGLAARVLMVAFAASNTLFIAVDGVVAGLLAATDPTLADALWASPAVSTLANVTGAAWSGALLAVALERYPSRPVLVGVGLTWLTFIASSALPLTGLISRVVALGVATTLVYSKGAGALPTALTVFAAVLRQHVGPEAALGMLCLALAAAVRERSAPAAASPP